MVTFKSNIVLNVIGKRKPIKILKTEKIKGKYHYLNLYKMKGFQSNNKNIIINFITFSFMKNKKFYEYFYKILKYEKQEFEKQEQLLIKDFLFDGTLQIEKLIKSQKLEKKTQ